MTTPTPEPIRLMLFDIAGTLMRDTGRTPAAYRAVLEDAGLEADEAWIRRRIGMRKTTVFAELLAAAGRSESEAESLAEAFDAVFLDDLDRTPPERLPGAAESWDAMRAAGVLVGWISGFSREVGDACIRGLGLTPDVAVGSDEVAEGRPAPDLVQMAMRRTGVADPRTVAVCGDTPRDLECGTAAECGLVVGVGHGTHQLEELAGWPHTHLVPDLVGFEHLVLGTHPPGG
ncbi:MAG: HAD family hydrolase [Planctomycetota bacterium]|jgi:phosphonatase-like hydrolase